MSGSQTQRAGAQAGAGGQRRPVHGGHPGLHPADSERGRPAGRCTGGPATRAAAAGSETPTGRADPRQFHAGQRASATADTRRSAVSRSWPGRRCLRRRRCCCRIPSRNHRSTNRSPPRKPPPPHPGRPSRNPRPPFSPSRSSSRTRQLRLSPSRPRRRSPWPPNQRRSWRNLHRRRRSCHPSPNQRRSWLNRRRHR